MFGALMLTSFFACGPTKEDAIKYNDSIITEQRKVVDKENELTGAIKNNAGNLDEILAGLSKQVEESTAAVTKMEEFDLKSDQSYLSQTIGMLDKTYDKYGDNKGILSKQNGL